MLVKKDFFSRKKTFNLDLDPVILSPDPEPPHLLPQKENFLLISVIGVEKMLAKKVFF